MNEARRVFVYGTLMPGQPRWPYLSRYAASWEPASTPGRLWATGRGYPAARFGDPGTRIPGVLVALRAETADEAIGRLDEIEGEGILYRRVEITTSGGPAVSYEWLGSTDELEPLPGGWS